MINFQDINNVSSRKNVKVYCCAPKGVTRNDDIFLNDYYMSIQLRDSPPAARDRPYLFHDLLLNIYNDSIPGYGRRLVINAGNLGQAKEFL